MRRMLLICNRFTQTDLTNILWYFKILNIFNYFLLFTFYFFYLAIRLPIYDDIYIRKG